MGKGERFKLEPKNVQEELRKPVCNVLNRRLVDEHRGITKRRITLARANNGFGMCDHNALRSAPTRVDVL